MNYSKLYTDTITPQGQEFIFKELIQTLVTKTGQNFLDTLKSNDLSFDLDKTRFKPNHACMWNRINNINRTCAILATDSKLALVAFVGEFVKDSLVLSNIYRLEDLSIIRDNYVRETNTIN